MTVDVKNHIYLLLFFWGNCENIYSITTLAI
jgi:hypothetical protein